MEDYPSPFAPKTPSRAPWIVAGVAIVSALVMLFVFVVPAQSESGATATKLERCELELGALKKFSEDQKAKVTELQTAKDSLSKEQSETRDQLNSAIKEKEAALAELQEAQRDLTDTLGAEIATGDVLIQERDGQLVVDVSDTLLFDKGKAEINERGQELLSQVSKSMKRLPPKLKFQVAGHTDSQRVVSPELVERYPTNWELSTARATNVVRYLQEKGKVSGKRLIAAGMAEYRPASSNNTEAGRQKNRRIEITILIPAA